jgi:hypothetical protein
VFGLYEETCSVGVYRQGQYCGFRQSSVSFHEGYFTQALRQLQVVLETIPDTQLEAVFTFGSATTNSLLDSLRSLITIPVKKFDPKSGMPFLTNEAAGVISDSAPFVFDVPVSAAILGLQ